MVIVCNPVDSSTGEFFLFFGHFLIESALTPFCYPSWQLHYFIPGARFSNTVPCKGKDDTVPSRSPKRLKTPQKWLSNPLPPSTVPRLYGIILKPMMSLRLHVALRDFVGIDIITEHKTTEYTVFRSRVLRGNVKNTPPTGRRPGKGSIWGATNTPFASVSLNF